MTAITHSTETLGGSQAGEAYDRLLCAIRSGDLAPGARLTETDLARRLATSRTPVREAIRRLEADGLVDHIPRVGAAIRRLGHAEVMELYEMREVLEGTAARLAARTASEVELAELATLTADMRAATGADQAAALNRHFHATLLSASRNRFLQRSMDGLRKTLLILGPSTLEDTDRLAEALTEHDAVVEALATRDGVQAEIAMRAHIAGAQRSRLRQVRREAGL